jgi:hypothetical protein
MNTRKDVTCHKHRQKLMNRTNNPFIFIHTFEKCNILFDWHLYLIKTRDPFHKLKYVIIALFHCHADQNPLFVSEYHLLERTHVTLLNPYARITKQYVRDVHHGTVLHIKQRRRKLEWVGILRHPAWWMNNKFNVVRAEIAVGNTIC